MGTGNENAAHGMKELLVAVFGDLSGSRHGAIFSHPAIVDMHVCWLQHPCTVSQHRAHQIPPPNALPPTNGEYRPAVKVPIWTPGPPNPYTHAPLVGMCHPPVASPG